MMIVVDGAEQCRRRRRSSPGSIPGGMRPLRLLHCRSEYTSGATGARRGQSWHRRLWMSRRTPGIDGVEPGHTFSIDDSIEECACC
jgi:hypothetical protein